MASLVIIEISAMIGRRRTNQAALARAIGKGSMWLSDRMTGRVRLTIDDLALIASGLQVNLVDLLPSAQRERVTVGYPPDRHDVMSLMPRPRSAGPVSGLHAPLPDKMSLSTAGRAPAYPSGRRPSLVRPMGA
jgi:hypothetical protein